MNCSITSVFLCKMYSFSSILSSRSHIYIGKSLFSQSFVSILRHDPQSLILIQNTFSSFLQHPISVVSTNQRLVSSNSSVFLSKCTFSSCFSCSEPGGGLFVSKSSSIVSISSCSFLNCTSLASVSIGFLSSMNAGGGGAAIYCSSVSFVDCCFSQCMSPIRGPSLFIASSGFGDAHLNFTELCFARNGYCNFHFGQGNPLVSNVNSSNNHCETLSGGAFTYNGLYNIIQFSYISNCISDDPIAYKAKVLDFSFSSAFSISRMCNIVNNSLMSSDKCTLYSYTNTLSLYNFAFISNPEPLILSDQGTIKLYNSITDTASFGGGISVEGNTFMYTSSSKPFIEIPLICDKTNANTQYNHGKSIIMFQLYLFFV